MNEICSKKLDDNLSNKILETKDEALLVYKIVRAYSDTNEEEKLYELLTGVGHNNPFLFLEAKWDSDISVGVKYCTIRNQLQRVIDNALYFSFNPESIDKIYVTLLTPKKYKDCYEEKLNSRFYGYKYGEYSSDSSIILRELEIIKSELPWKEEKNLDLLIQENIKKLTLNWVTFEELLEKISGNSIREEIEVVYKKLMLGKEF